MYDSLRYSQSDLYYAARNLGASINASGICYALSFLAASEALLGEEGIEEYFGLVNCLCESEAARTDISKEVSHARKMYTKAVNDVLPLADSLVESMSHQEEAASLEAGLVESLGEKGRMVLYDGVKKWLGKISDSPVPLSAEYRDAQKKFLVSEAVLESDLILDKRIHTLLKVEAFYNAAQLIYVTGSSEDQRSLYPPAHEMRSPGGKVNPFYNADSMLMPYKIEKSGGMTSYQISIRQVTPEKLSEFLRVLIENSNSLNESFSTIISCNGHAIALACTPGPLRRIFLSDPNYLPGIFLDPEEEASCQMLAECMSRSFLSDQETAVFREMNFKIYGLKKNEFSFGRLIRDCDYSGIWNDLQGVGQLHTLIRYHDIDSMKKLYEAPDHFAKMLNLKSKQYGTPLQMAILHKEIEITEFLLKAGAKTDVIDLNRDFPLDLAIRTGSSRMISLVFGYMRDEEKKLYLQHRSYNSLIEREDYGRMSQLIKIGMYVVDEDKWMDAINSANLKLVAAILEGNQEMTKFSFSEDGCTALHIAVEEKNIALIELLVNKGADVNHEDHNGISPLALAGNNRKIVEALTQNSQSHSVYHHLATLFHPSPEEESQTVITNKPVSPRSTNS